MIARTATLSLLLFAGIAFVTAQDPAKRLSDEEIAKLVIGKWSQNRKIEDTEIKAIDEFFKDGAYKSKGSLTTGEKVLKVAIIGKWKVSNGFLVTVIETHEEPDILPKGHESKDKVIAISKNEMKLKTKYGNEFVRTRNP
jgi:hypothetical protein